MWYHIHNLIGTFLVAVLFLAPSDVAAGRSKQMSNAIRKRLGLNKKERPGLSREQEETCNQYVRSFTKRASLSISVYEEKLVTEARRFLDCNHKKKSIDGARVQLSILAMKKVLDRRSKDQSDA